MKFQTEKKKPTLCIYTDEDYSTEKLEWDVRRLREQLDCTRSALRLQAARCRHLVAAFGSQIRRSEVAARRERELRDDQLSRLLRALLVLDAGLRREQRHIRDQLRSKDSLIHAQRLEIAMLRERRADASLTDVVVSEDMFGEVTSHTEVKPHGGLDELQRMSNGLKEEINGITSNDDSCFMDHDDEALSRNLYEDYQHNPVLECVNQILLRDFEDDDKENYQRPPRAAPPLPPVKSQHLEEKACLKMASQRLTLARPALPPKPKELATKEKHTQRKILSNGSLKYPLNENSKTFDEKLDEMNITVLHANTPRGIAVMSRPDPGEKIKIGSSVSFLITGAAGGSIVNELSQDVEPTKVSSIVQRFEHLGKEVDEDRENFEEFKLEEVDLEVDKGRAEGDGQETTATYDNFLEATGLSQKSIMTPSRMFNSHRSVVKPKDVKHRSKLLKAASVSTHGGNIVKYWTEPFL